jgi:hypothetical protein
MPKRPSVIKQLSDMAIDEVSLVDRGANQHALISFAKSASGVDELFDKARKSGGGVTDTGKTGTNVEPTETHSGSDPAGVVDEFVQNKKKGDVGPGATISGTEKKSAKDVKVKSAEAGSAKGGSSSGGEEVDTDADDDDDMVLAKALGLLIDELEDDIEKGFGPQAPFPQQQSGPPQFGNPPAMQTTGAMPMGMGAPQTPPMMGGMPGAPGMPGAMPGAMGGPQMPGQGAPPQLGMAQLPPEAIAYIQQLEAKLAQLQGQNNPGQSDSGGESKPESSDSSSGGSDSDSSNKPFGKSGDFNVDGNAFLEELSKAIRDEDRDEFSKALQTRFEAYEAEISKAHEIAKAERDLRLERDFIAKAAEFDVPVAAEELGPVLKRLAESVSEEDFAVIVKCLDAATELSQEVFGEVGKRGTGTNDDLMSQVNAQAEELSKNHDLDGASAISAVLEANPEAYDEYRRSLPGFRL